MWISRQKRKENIAEYLLYMWQLEDSLRAFKFDAELIERNLVQPTAYTGQQKQEMLNWYIDLAETMRAESVSQTGHLQVNTNVLMDLTDLHVRLMSNPEYQAYQQTYTQLYPVLDDLRKRIHDSPTDIELCFRLLYMVLLMRLKQQAIGIQTLQAQQQVSAFVSRLAGYYHSRERGEIEL